MPAVEEKAPAVFPLAALPSTAITSPARFPLTENPHPGHQLPTAILYLGIGEVNSNTTTGFATSLYDSGIRSRYRNMYSYALNNPLAFIDPSGLDPCPPGSTADTCANVTDTAPGVGTVTVAPGQCVAVYVEGQSNGSYCNTGGNSTQIAQQPQPPQPPPPPQKPKTPFGSCMEKHATDFSVAGFVDNAFAASGHPGFQPLNNFFGSAAFGNNITGAWFAVFGNSDQSTGNALTTAVNQGLIGNVGVVGGLGTNLTAGARGSSIMSLNLAGKPGVGAQALARSSGVRSGLTKLAKFGKATTILDAGLTLGEAIDCATGAIK